MMRHLRRSRVSGRPAPDPAAHGGHGDGGDLPAPAHGARLGAPDLPLHAARPRYLPGGPCVVRGHHLYPCDARIFLPCGRDGLGHPRAMPGGLCQHRWTPSCIGALDDALVRASGDPEHGPGKVHQRPSPTGCWVRAWRSPWRSGPVPRQHPSGCGSLKYEGRATCMSFATAFGRTAGRASTNEVPDSSPDADLPQRRLPGETVRGIRCRADRASPRTPGRTLVFIGPRGPHTFHSGC